MEEIKLGEIVVDEEIELGEIELDILKVYPELENLIVTPSNEEQKFKSSKYGYDEVTVNAIETEEIKLTPTRATQIKEGLFNKVTIEGEENLKAENIKKGTTMFGIEGTVEGPDEELETSFGSLIGEELGANITKLPKGVTKIRDSAFVYCTNLKKIELHEEITEIGANTFADCTNLEEVIIKGNFNKTNRMAFGRCSKLTKIVFVNITKVPSLGLYTFLSTPIDSGSGFIYVPDNLVDTFKANSSWSSYQIKPITELEA